MRYFLHLAYQGKNYSGWQRQSTAPSVQQVIEDSISKMLKQKVYIHGCGRTDAGVHASQYFAHVDISKVIDFDFISRINMILPPDISIYELIPVEESFHAQYDAKIRSYTYHLHIKKIPAKSELSAYYKIDKLDTDKIHQAIKILQETKDFRSLCKNPDIYKHTLCTIYDISFMEESKDLAYRFDIKADRFLRGMIRYIVARLIDIGTNKLSLEEFNTTLSNRSEFGYKFQKAGYPQGLYLSKVEYPYLSRECIQK